MKLKSFLSSITLAGASAVAMVISSPALAAFDAYLNTVQVDGDAATGQSVLMELGITGLDSTGIDLTSGDAIGLSATIEVPAAGPFRIQMYDDPGTAADYTSDSLGSFFSALIGPVVLAGPNPGPDTSKVLSFVFSAWDPVGGQAVPIPSSGVLARFVLTAPPASTPGSWTVTANVEADDGISAPFQPQSPATAMVAVVPEPETYALFATGLGIMVLGVARGRRRTV